MQNLQQEVFHIGLFAGIPAADEQATFKAVSAVAEGGICGVILPWHKHVFEALAHIRTHFPQLLMGVQGPWIQASQTLTGGAAFVVSHTPVATPQAVYLRREGSALICPVTQQVLAACSNKIVFVEDMHAQDWARITRRAKNAINNLLGFELRHVGINNPDENTSSSVAGQFEQFFHFPKEDKGGAFFAGPYIESMKKPFYGTHGHIAISTPCPARAAWYLQKRGAKFNWDSAGYNEDGSLRVVYLQDEIGGFAVHIVQK